MRGPKDRRSRPDGRALGRGEREVEEEEKEEELGEEECVISDEDYDTDLELEGIHKIDIREIKLLHFMIEGVMCEKVGIWLDDVSHMYKWTISSYFIIYIIFCLVF